MENEVIVIRARRRIHQSYAHKSGQIVAFIATSHKFFNPFQVADEGKWDPGYFRDIIGSEIW